MIKLKKHKKHIIILFIISIFFLQILFLTVKNPNPNVNLDPTEISVKQEGSPLEKPLIAAAGDPNLTRVNYPIVLSNETATELWTALHNLSVDDIRIAYYSMDDKWELVPLQLDEKGYFRSFRINVGSQAEFVIAGPPNQIHADITNWGQYVAEHRYAGKDIDANDTADYKEPTKYECELGFWPTRLAEFWANSSQPAALPDNDTSSDPGRPTPEPILNPREDPLSPQGKNPATSWLQLPNRVDYDDELVFYAQNGKKATIDNWNFTDALGRYEIELIDPVDGGQSWMYVYYNVTSTVHDLVPDQTNNFFIPPGGKDFVNWSETNLKVTGQNYEYTIDANNKDLTSNVTVNLPGSAPTTLYTETGKQWMAINLRIIQLAEVAPGSWLTVFDLQDSADLWREGEWGYPPNRDPYNEQNTSIGYNLKMDLDLKDLDKWFPGQDDDYNNSHRHTGVAGYGSQPHGGIQDIYHSLGALLLLSHTDDADHDNETTENAPFLRGELDDSGASNEAAIDGPCRVILDKFTTSMFGFDLGNYFIAALGLDVIFGYEEFWSIEHSTHKFYGNMTSDDPTEISADYSDQGSAEQKIIARLHHAFIAGQNFTTNVRNDPEAYILLGQAPNGTQGLPDLTQCRHENKSWPLTLYPDGIDDAVLPNTTLVSAHTLIPPGGPVEDHFDNTSLVTNSTGTGVGDGNPLSDWAYVHTSGGGAWSYIPYNETWEMFTQEKYRDLAWYWNDNENFTEMAIYGNHGNLNGKTDPFPSRTVFGNFTEWECKREYARLKFSLVDFMVLTGQTQDKVDPEWEPEPENIQVQRWADLPPYTVHATDRWGIKEYWINDTTNFTIKTIGIIESSNLNESYGVITNNTALSLARSPYWVEVVAFDYANNNCSAIISITVVDPGPAGNPVWLINPEDQLTEAGEPFIYNVSASDSDGIKKYWINDTATFSIGANNGTIINAIDLVVGVHDLNISVCDNLFNNASAIITITIVDTTSPTWDEDPTDQTIGHLFLFTYYVNASDFSGIKKFWVNDTANFAIFTFGDSGAIINTAILLYGVNYRLNISVCDNFFNNLSVIITITVEDWIDPYWVGLPTNRTVRIESATAKAKFEYDVDANDVSSGINRYWISAPAFFDIDNDGTITSDVLRLGIYEVEIRAYDAVDRYCAANITITVLRELESVTTYEDDVDEILSDKVPIFDVYIYFAIVISSVAAIAIIWIIIKRH